MAQPTPRPEGRYGAPSPAARRATVGAAVALATAFVGWVVWAALGAAAPGVRGEVTAFRVLSADAVDVRVTVAGGAEGAVGCSVRALDRTREVVGVGTIVLDPSRPGQREGWVIVRTRDRAVTATLDGCAPVSPASKD